MAIISYAQHYEDMILAALLSDVKKGFYVDVGANDPVRDSVTNHFYREGWSGINIEPMPSMFAKLASRRKRDRNVNVGISDQPGSLMLREIGLNRHGLSSFKPSDKIPSYLPFKEYEVPVTTLSEILKDIEHIDFLKVDVEGMEFEVLNGYDWHVKPEVILMEDNGATRWLPLLEKQGYTQICYDGLNRYFVPHTSKRDLSSFQTILNQEVIPLPLHNLRTEQEKLKKELVLANERLVDSVQRHEQLMSQHHEIQTHPEHFFSIRQLVKAVLRRAQDRFKAS